MDADKLGAIVRRRLRDHPRLDLDVVKDFVFASPSTIHTWLTNDKVGPPRGERLNRLWHLLAAVGIDSPELDRLPEFHRYAGELHAYGVVPFKAESNDNDIDMLALLGLQHEQGVLRVLRGDQNPQNPLIGMIGNNAGRAILSAEPLIANYGAELDAAKALWHPRFDQALPGKVAKPAPTQQIAATRIEAPVPSAPEPQIVTPVIMPRVASPIDEHILDLAKQLAALVPLLQLAISSECSDEDRARLRKLVGQENLHNIRMALTRLTSTRAYNESS